jgi:hypothetical protein
VTAIPGSNNSYNYGFTTIVSSPDANIANGIFNALTLQTQNYGVIPVVPNDWTMVSNTSNTIGTGSKTFVWSFGAPFLPVVGQPVTIRDNTASLTNVMTGTVTSWTPGTNTLVVNVTSAVGSGSSSNWSIISTSYVAGTLYLRTNVEWAHFSFGQNNQVSGGDLQTEIQACTTLHCCEVPQTFVGTGLDIQGVHVEQSAGTPICFLTAGASFGSSFPCDVRHIYFNSNQNSNYGGNNDQFFAAQTFPFIYIQSCDVNLENSVTTQNYGPNGVIIDFSEDTGGYQHNLVNNWYQTTNYRIGQQIGYPTNSRQLLGGANKTPFFVSQSVNSYDVQWRQHWGFVEMLGCRPRPGTLPAILPGDITVLQGALPAITHSGSGSSITYNVPYPLMWGGHPYQTTDWYSATSATYISNHHAYTYGQNLTTTNVPNLSWRYKAGGNVVYANAELFNLLFVGLQVVLNDGVSDHTYMVIGMYPNVAAADNSFPGYFTVVGFDAINSASLLSGTPANSIKTGTLIKQEPFAIVAA